MIIVRYINAQLQANTLNIPNTTFNSIPKYQQSVMSTFNKMHK